MAETPGHEWDPFTRPQPTWSCLTNPAILVQAWKKTHSYLRSKSWFADVLELDLSAVDLKGYIDELRQELGAGPDSFVPRAMRLVPAPKSDRYPWVFRDGGWFPGDKTKQFARPLAHLLLRDQVLATAIMICMADYVESEQGDCSLQPMEAKAAGISSYGNRLLCDWGKRGSAEFTWGNASLYRKYYADYRSFLSRPLEVCRNHRIAVSGNAELGVVALDLQSFYDNIPRKQVIKSLKAICDRRGAPADTAFWEAVEKCFSWEWDLRDNNWKSVLKSGSLPMGLPQGLVAAGFFSNAYMNVFDRRIRVGLKKADLGEGLRIIDYCRYVDDIRLVVSGGSAAETPGMKSRASEWLCSELKKHLPEQVNNVEKMAFVSYEELDSRTVRQTLMSAIQQKLSGPADLETLEQAGFAIDGLLNTIGDAEDVDGWQPGDVSASLELSLSRIHFTKNNVRDDTVIRFASYRKLTTLRERRYLLAAEDSESQKVAIERIDAEIETSARKMLYLWSRDPSLAIVLRHALNLFPTPELLEPVIEAIKYSCRERQTDKTLASFSRAVGLFTTGELFKAGVVETGIDVEAGVLPSASDIDGYREVLGDLAEEMLKSAKLPWYVARQASMYLVSIGRSPVLPIGIKKHIGDDYLSLIEIASGNLSVNQSPSKIISLVLVLDQLGSDRGRTINKLSRLFFATGEGAQNAMIEQLYFANPGIATEFLIHLKSKRINAGRVKALVAAFPGDVVRDRHSVDDVAKEAPLLRIIMARDNPFSQETAALQLLAVLARGIIKDAIPLNRLRPDGLYLSSKHAWRRLIVPRINATFTVEAVDSLQDDPRYILPEWVEGERAKLYALGRLVRAAAIGSADYTSMGHQVKQFRDGYCGLRSSWFKRQHGLSGDLATAEWDCSSCSPWFTSLISHLLAWPGCRQDIESEFGNVKSVESLLGVVCQRLKRLKGMFGWGSKLPVYDVSVNHALKQPPIISMALLQTVRPTHGDLQKHGPELNADLFRPVHRGHLATMLRIASDHVELRRSYGKRPCIDFVVLPEISVHRDDLDLLERFIDATQAIVFCGLSFYRHEKAGGLVNSGLWIIPQRRKTGRSFVRLFQGKQHMIPAENKMNILPYRPHQFILEIDGIKAKKRLAISAAICFDATDLRLASDLRDQTDMLIVSANNKDVPTFDTMASALSWHMFQHIVIVNSGEFGGSVVSAPYREKHLRVLKHDHGGHQAGISIVEIDLSDYQRMREHPPAEFKSPPAGFSRH